MATTYCPHCSQSFESPDDAPAASVRCPHCQRSVAADNAAVASGEPPTPAPAREPDEGLPSERRDIAKKSSSAVPILIVGAIVAAGLCVCALPALFFLGAFSFVVGRQDVRHEQAAAAEQAHADKPLIAVGDAPVLREGAAKGRAEAADAIAKDKLLLKEYPPLPAPAWHSEYIKLLKERCKCDYQVIQEQNLPKAQVDEINAWNEAMTAELIRRHGPKIMMELHAEAEKRWRAGIGGK